MLSRLSVALWISACTTVGFYDGPQLTTVVEVPEDLLDQTIEAECELLTTCSDDFPSLGNCRAHHDLRIDVDLGCEGNEVLAQDCLFEIALIDCAQIDDGYERPDVCEMAWSCLD